MFRRVFFILCVLNFVTGCGGDIGTPNSTETSFIKPDEPLTAVLTGPLRDYKIEDDHSSNLSRMVGALFIDENNITKLCTGTIVGALNNRSVVLTARHCVDEFIRSKMSCSKKIQFRLAGNAPANNLEASCERILPYDQISDLEISNKKSLDFAFLLLNKKFNVPAVQFRQDSVPDNTLVTIHHIDTEKLKDKIFVLRGTQCSSVMGSLANSHYIDNPNSPLITTHGCNLIEGSSGGAVTNIRNEIIGVHSGGFSKETVMQSLSPSLSGISILEVPFENLVKQNIFTRLGCIGFSALGLAIDDSKSCLSTELKNQTGLSILLEKSQDIFAQELKADLLKWIQENSNEVGFRIENSYGGPFHTQRPTIQIHPLCFVDAKQTNWLKRHKESHLGGLYSTYKKSSKIELEIPEYQILIRADEMLRPSVSFQKNIIKYKIRFNPSELDKTGTSDVVIQRAQNNDFVESESNFSTCTEEMLSNVE